MPGVEHDLLDAVLFNYQLSRNTGDSRIAQRAIFYSEFGHLQYLLHGATMRDQYAVEEAIRVLDELAEQAEEGLLAPLTDTQANAMLTPVADVIDFVERTTGSMPIIPEDRVLSGNDQPVAADDYIPSFLNSDAPTAPVAVPKPVSEDTDQIYLTGGPNYDDDSTAPMDRI